MRSHSKVGPSAFRLTMIIFMTVSVFFTLVFTAVHLEDQRIQLELDSQSGAYHRLRGKHLHTNVDVSKERHFNPDWIHPGVLQRHLPYFGSYRLAPPPCPPNTTIFIWIHSAVDHFAQRQLVRDSWVDPEYFRRELGVGLAYAFGVALPDDSLHDSDESDSVMDENTVEVGEEVEQKTAEELQKELRAEFMLHKDLVQMEYIDSYYNVTYKAVGGLWYASRRCPSHQLFLKLDDDTFVARGRLTRFLRLLLSKDVSGRLNQTFSRTMMAFFSKSEWTVPVRNRHVRNYIGDSEWPLAKFANYAAPGLAYFITGDLVSDLLQAANQVRWIWLEDVFILGVLREEMLRRGQIVRMLSLAPNIVHLYKNVINKQRDMYLNKQKVFVGDHPASHWMDSFRWFEDNG